MKIEHTRNVNTFMDNTPGKPIRTYNEQGKWRDWSTDEIVGQRLNVTKGWICGAGVENLYIDMDGDVWTASCRVGGKLGNIWNDFLSPSNWINCTKELCTCGADLFIPKVNQEQNLPLLRKTQGLSTESDKYEPTLADFIAMERTHASTTKQVYWEISRRCNFDCSYCWSWIHNNTDRHRSLEELMKATHLLEDKFIKNKSVNFIISGGEPTANPAFLDWLRYLYSCGHHISLHSNGSRKPEYYQEVIHYGDLNLSVHFEFYNRERFLKVVEAVAREKATSSTILGHLEVKIMMAPHNHNEAISLEEDLKNIPYFKDWCTWTYVPIRGGLTNKTIQKGSGLGSDEVMPGYTDEQKNLFGNNG
jgi:organic radical activating enzyme